PPRCSRTHLGEAARLPGGELEHRRRPLRGAVALDRPAPVGQPALHVLGGPRDPLLLSGDRVLLPAPGHLRSATVRPGTAAPGVPGRAVARAYLLWALPLERDVAREVRRVEWPRERPVPRTVAVLDNVPRRVRPECGRRHRELLRRRAAGPAAQVPGARLAVRPGAPRLSARFGGARQPSADTGPTNTAAGSPRSAIWPS